MAQTIADAATMSIPRVLAKAGEFAVTITAATLSESKPASVSLTPRRFNMACRLCLVK